MYTLLPGKCTEGAVKALPVQTKNRNAVEILKHTVNARRFIKRKVSSQNLYTKQVNKLLEYEKSCSTCKGESVAKNSSNISGIKMTSSMGIY